MNHSFPGFINFEELFKDQNILCFTSDIEWAPEWAIKILIDDFKKADIPLTPFLTHESDILKKEFLESDKSQYAGIHPNFLRGSDHGETYEDVSDFFKKLHPKARSFRSHCFYSDSRMTSHFFEQGFIYDSNLCLYLTRKCLPFVHNSGLISFPVFWEDDIHWTWEDHFHFKNSKLEKELLSPGLKVFNIHPLNMALNIPSNEYYLNHKFCNNLESLEEARKNIYEGHGVRTFVNETIELILKKNLKCYYLDEIYHMLF